jgi:hypothetical protein
MGILIRRNSKGGKIQSGKVVDKNEASRKKFGGKVLTKKKP